MAGQKTLRAAIVGGNVASGRQEKLSNKETVLSGNDRVIEHGDHVLGRERTYDNFGVNGSLVQAFEVGDQTFAVFDVRAGRGASEDDRHFHIDGVGEYGMLDDDIEYVVAQNVAGNESDLSGKSHMLAVRRGESVVLGRDHNNDVFSYDAGVSREHVGIHIAEEGLVIADQDSTNGVRLVDNLSELGVEKEPHLKRLHRFAKKAGSMLVELGRKGKDSLRRTSAEGESSAPESPAVDKGATVVDASEVGAEREGSKEYSTAESDLYRQARELFSDKSEQAEKAAIESMVADAEARGRLAQAKFMLEDIHRLERVDKNTIFVSSNANTQVRGMVEGASNYDSNDAGLREFIIPKTMERAGGEATAEISSKYFDDAEPIQIPLHAIVSAERFKSWDGRGDVQSREKIANYASKESEAPAIDDLRMFILPDGRVFYKSNNAHRVGAAKLNGDSTIAFKGDMQITLVTEEGADRLDMALDNGDGETV